MSRLDSLQPQAVKRAKKISKKKLDEGILVERLKELEIIKRMEDRNLRIHSAFGGWRKDPGVLNRVTKIKKRISAIVSERREILERLGDI